jgi:GntR family transcriptional regulator, rspAB operon transcriptional repressor
MKKMRMTSSTQKANSGLASRADRKPRISLRDKAYEAIKNNIITCAYPPGECINEALVASMIGLGRTPVHQAVDRLRLEGLVEVMPRKGVIVKPVVLPSVMQMIEVRLINECFCARLAAERASDDDVRALRHVAKLARAAISKQDVNTLMSLDREFHEVLARAAKNDELANIVLRLNEQSLRFWFISFGSKHHVSFQEQHEALIDAVESRDQETAETLMRQHIEAFRESVALNL